MAFGNNLLDPVCLHQSRDACCNPGIAISEALQADDIAAHPTCRFWVSAKAVHLPADRKAIQDKGRKGRLLRPLQETNLEEREVAREPVWKVIN